MLKCGKIFLAQILEGTTSKKNERGDQTHLLHIYYFYFCFFKNATPFKFNAEKIHYYRKYPRV